MQNPLVQQWHQGIAAPGSITYTTCYRLPLSSFGPSFSPYQKHWTPTLALSVNLSCFQWRGPWSNKRESISAPARPPIPIVVAKQSIQAPDAMDPTPQIHRQPGPDGCCSADWRADSREDWRARVLAQGAGKEGDSFHKSYDSALSILQDHDDVFVDLAFDIGFS